MTLPEAIELWGPWKRHDGRGMPVRVGTIVDAYTLVPKRFPKDGCRRKVGIAGVDLINSCPT